MLRARHRDRHRAPPARPSGGRAADDDDGTRAVSVEATTAGAWGVAVPVVDRLDDGDVLAITVTDGVARSEGTVRQCTQTATGFDGCTNRFPVQFGDDGRRRFQYRSSIPARAAGRRPASWSSVMPAAIARPSWPRCSAARRRLHPPPCSRRPGRTRRARRSPSRCPTCTPAPTSRRRSAPRRAAVPRHAVAEPDGTATIAVTVGDRCRGCGVVVVSGAGAARAGRGPVRAAPDRRLRHDEARRRAGRGRPRAAAGVAHRRRRRLAAAVRGPGPRPDIG